MRLLIFASHPTQYQSPIFRSLAALEGMDLTVLFGSDHGVSQSFDSGFGHSVPWDVPLLEGYTHEFLENEARRADVNSFMGISVPRVRDRIAAHRPDAVLVMGWQTRGHVQAIAAARSRKIPILLFGDSTLGMWPSARWKAWLRKAIWLRLRKPVYSRIFRDIDGVLSAGIRNEAYYRSFGVRSERIFRVGHAVENSRFALPEPVRLEARNKIRSSLGIPRSDFVFLSVAKIQEKKRPLDLLEAFRAAAAKQDGMSLVFVGDGEQRQELSAQIARSQMRHSVKIVGFVNQSELPEWYSLADCLVLPSDSRETWGLAVNEAFASGVPAIVSDAVGCAPDLVVNEKNGRIFPLGDTHALGRAMLWMVERGSDELNSMAQCAVATIREFSPECVAERIRDAAEMVACRVKPIEV